MHLGFSEVLCVKDLEQLAQCSLNADQLIKQNISEIDNRKPFPENEILEHQEKILQNILKRKTEFDKRRSERERDLEELFDFGSIEWGVSRILCKGEN